MTEVPADEPVTAKQWIRIVGTVVLLIVAIWVANFWQREVKLPVITYNAAALTPAQIAKQDEILAEKRSWVDVVVVRGETRYLYTRDRTWGTERRDWLDQNNDPVLYDGDKSNIAGVAKAAIMMKKPAWLMQGNGHISVVDYNSNLYGLKLLIWIGMAAAFLIHMLIFHHEGGNNGGGFGCLAIIILIIGAVAATATQPSPYLIAFFLPCVYLLLLHGLFREPESAEIEEGEVAPE